MNIVLSPNPILRTKCSTIEKIDKQTKKLAKNMCNTMYRSNGVGLAAPQVGVTQRLVVIDTQYSETNKKKPYILINPEIVYTSDETMVSAEGCLSIPGVMFDITRHQSVKVEATDLDGKRYGILAEGNLLATCLQHELDHLEGITMFERLDPQARMRGLREYQEALKAGARPGEVSAK